MNENQLTNIQRITQRKDKYYYICLLTQSYVNLSYKGLYNNIVLSVI
nr:MAG TPA: hypothetical protein [Caudoviricetes sp.]